MSMPFEPSLSSSISRQTMVPAGPSIADSLPNINFGFDDLRDRMTKFSARFDAFIEQGRKRVLEERNQFRMNVAELQGAHPFNYSCAHPRLSHLLLPLSRHTLIHPHQPILPDVSITLRLLQHPMTTLYHVLFKMPQSIPLLLVILVPSTVLSGATTSTVDRCLWMPQAAFQSSAGLLGRSVPASSGCRPAVCGATPSVPSVTTPVTAGSPDLRTTLLLGSSPNRSQT